MPIGIGVAFKLFSSLLDFFVKKGQMKKEEADQIRADALQVEIQKDKTFSDFMHDTSDIVYTLVRNAIVVGFASSLFIPGMAATLKETAQSLPIYFWLIIGWEFYGNQMLQAIPWFKGGNGNGGNGGSGNPVTVADVVGTDPQPGPLPNPAKPAGQTTFPGLDGTFGGSTHG